MKRIAAKLIEFGMEFQYEHNGSSGEEIQSFECDVKVSFKEGKIYLEREGETKVLDENEKNREYIVLKVDEACIEETT